MTTAPGGVRPFRREDEPAVRAICVENARLPEAARHEDWVFADYWTRYYTRREPEHVWVAEKDGVVVGYLTAAFDTTRHNREMRSRVLPGLLLRMSVRGTIMHMPSRLFFLKRWATWSAPDPEPAGLLETFPAYLHVNLRDGARGLGLGAALMEACLAEATRAALPGIHLKTLETNAGAIRFFERMGFSLVGKQHPFARLDPALKDRAVVVYGRRL